MIDLNKLELMLDGDEAMVHRFIEIFKTQTPVQLDQLFELVTEKNWSDASITAHAIKSQCSYLGLDDIVEHANKIEKLTEKKEHLNLIPGLVSLLQTKITEVLNKELQ